MKPISIRFTDEELAAIGDKAAKINMSRSDYIRYHVMSEEVIQIADKSKEFYQSLNHIHGAIDQLEAKYSKVDCGAVREEVMKACQLLNL